MGGLEPGKDTQDQTMKRWALAVACSLLAIVSGITPYPSMAQYPAKPIRIIVPFSAGASTDIVARAVAQRFTDAWKQSAFVENRLGAAGTSPQEFGEVLAREFPKYAKIIQFAGMKPE